MIHLDTSFVVDLLRERARGQGGAATTWLERERRSELAVSLFVLCELEAGASASWHSVRERDRVRAVLSSVMRADPTEGFAARYGSVLVAIQRTGATIATMDLLIATTALEHRAAVVTANRRHFAVVPGLDVITYRDGV